MRAMPTQAKRPGLSARTATPSPVAVAVVSSYLVVAVARYFLTERREGAEDAEPAPAA